MRTALTTIALFLFLSVSAYAENVQISNIATKITDGPDSSGDVWYAIKATVKNNGSHDGVSITLQAIDREGFELADISLRGKIPLGGSKVLTTKNYMSMAQYKQIKAWQLKE